MSSYNTQLAITSYSVEKTALLGIEEYLRKNILEILNITKEELKIADKNEFNVTIYDSFGEESFLSIKNYKYPFFRNDTKGITLELEIDSMVRSLKITIRFGKEIESSDLSITITDENAREKVSAIEEGILLILDHHKNFNWLLYPRNQLVPGILLLGSVIAGIVALDNKKVEQVRILCGVFVFAVVFYFIVLRYLKGYCTFETKRQKQFDAWFNWLFWGVVGFLLFTTLLTSARKSILGF